MAARPIEQRDKRLIGGAVSTQPESEPGRMLELLQDLSAQRLELSEQMELGRRRQSELLSVNQRYLELYDRSQLGYVTVARGGRVTRVNDAALGLLGVGRGMMLSSCFQALLAEADVERFRTVLAGVFDTGRRAHLEVELTRRVRVRRCGKLLLARSRDSVLISLHDLRVAEAREGVLESDLRAIWDAFFEAIIVVDQGRIVACNRAAQQLFGKKHVELDRTPVQALLPGFPSDVRAPRLELLAYSHAGRATPVEVTVTRSQVGTGRLVAVITDITARRRDRIERLEALTRFNQLAEHLEDAFYVAAAPNGESLYVSPAFAAIYGRSLEAHAKQPWPRLEWVHPDDREWVAEAADRARDGAAFDVEYRIQHPSGDVRMLHDRAFFVPDGARITGIVRDVTEERRISEELKKAQRLEAMGTLASGVAHDFNNLLMGIGGCIQLALRRVEPSDAAHGYLERAADAILRGANLTKQILRIGDTRRVTEGQVVLDDVLLGARELVDSLIGEAIALVVETGAAGVRVVAESGDIEQILLNLVSNARDAMARGGRLTLKTEVDEDVVTLSVADTGVGMSPTVKGRVFEPFFTTKRAGKGTGLGLATVFALARRLGGTVALESEEGSGTTVYVSIPMARRPSQVPMVVGSLPKSGGEMVLLVDDDPLVRLTVENHLSGLGYRALVASNAEEAISFCEDESLALDLIVTDVMMPGMLGPELIQELRGRSRGLPVLFMSAHPREMLVSTGRLEPNARLLAKPFDANALAEAVATVLEEARRAAEGVTRRTLLVDDDSATTEVLCELLELEGHQVRAANTPEDALAVAADFRPDVVLCDLDLGAQTNGYELTAELRRDPRLRSTTFIALTGYSPREVRERARDAGFAKVLGKPLEMAKLRRLLRAPAR